MILSCGLKRYIAQLLSVGMILIPIQGCGPSRLAADCDRLQQTTYTLLPISAELTHQQPLDKAATISASEQQQTLAQQLAQIPLIDLPLSRYRNELVALYQHDSDLALQATAFMADSGEIFAVKSNRAAYEQVASQRLAIAQQVQDAQSHLVSYCGASEF